MTGLTKMPWLTHISLCSQNRGVYPSASNSHFSGMCTGSLVVAAIEQAKSLSELLPLAVKAVVLSLHVGMRAEEMRRRFDASTKSWAWLFPGLTYGQAKAVVESHIKSSVSASAVLFIHLVYQ